jgi:hypothetical protein
LRSITHEPGSMTGQTVSLPGRPGPGGEAKVPAGRTFSPCQPGSLGSELAVIVLPVGAALLIWGAATSHHPP